MDIEEYKQLYEDTDESPGWDAIDFELKKHYSHQKPVHWAPAISSMLGGEDPLEGISLYKSEEGINHFHLVTYGFSELFFDEESFGKEFSKFGFELTFRIKPFDQDEEYPVWAVQMLQNIAKYVFSTGNWFEPNHYMPANGPIRIGTKTELTALAIIKDPQLNVLQTPHGEVQFLQLIGITSAEFEKLKNGGKKVEKLIQLLKEENELLVTDLNRTSVW